MPYFPKSQIDFRISTGELIFKKTKQKFKGYYMATSNGKFYAGRNNMAPGPELIYPPQAHDYSPLKTGLAKSGKYFSFTRMNRKYNDARPDIKKFLGDKISVAGDKPTPSERDYRRGYFWRYFAKKFNGNSYLEISKNTYDKIKNKANLYDYNLYEVGRIRWYIKGNNVHKMNSLSILKQQKHFNNLINFFPVLTEYLRPSSNIQENLYTSGGELYYNDGAEYTGDYHIHPLKGPMVGATHSSTPHDILYYFNQLPEVSGQSYEDFLSNYNMIDCYKCVQVNKYSDPQILSNKRSNLLGCLPNTYPSEEEASNHCPAIELATIDLINRPPMVENSSNNYSSFEQTRPTPPIPLEGGNQDTIYVDDVINGGSTRPGGQPLQVYTCFTPNTLVTMANGSSKTISSIEIGEKVKSEKGESTVLDIQIHEGDFEVYSLNDSKPFVTPEHPFKTIDGWKAIDPITTLEKHQISSTTLNLNDILIKLKGQELIKKIEKGKYNYSKVYNLMLDNEHVYYANGYLVHNEKINT